MEFLNKVYCVKKIIAITVLFILSIMAINAQKIKRINNQLDLNKIKVNKMPDVTIKEGGRRGFVYNIDNLKQNISGVKVIFDSDVYKTRQTVVTDKSGFFEIKLKIGKYKLYAVKPGYIPYITPKIGWLVGC
ncbi:MAG: carboxypeptidase-like regulatory domain-containing protein [Cellulophaga sp.]